MAWSAAIGAVAQLASTAMANSANSAQNKASREWSTMMSNTEMQRRVADLKAAGLNPMLAVNGGGQGASYGNPNVIPMQAANVGEAASSAMQAYMARAQKTQVELQGDVLASQAQKNGAETAQALAMTRNIDADTAVKDVTVGKVVADTEFTSTSSANAKQQFFNLNAEYGKIAREIEEIASRSRGNELDNQQKIALNPLVLQLQALENKRMQLNMPRLENEAEAQKSEWMKKVSPYLPDILKSAGAGAAAGSAFRAFGK